MKNKIEVKEITGEDLERLNYMISDASEKDKIKYLMEECVRNVLFEENNELVRVRSSFRLLQELCHLGAANRCFVVCDETNNTPEILDNNGFVIEVLYQTTEQKEAGFGEHIILKAGVNYS